MEPMISVVMCCYNAEKYLRESIDSILNQTFKDFEFIIWNDGSTDSTEEIVKSYNDERIKYYYHTNTGLGMALRLACAETKGKYIARMDSDDISLPSRLEKELEFLESHEDYVLTSSAVYEINEKGGKIRRTLPCTEDKILKAILKVPNSMIVHPMVMMRRDAYEQAGGYLPIRKSQDVLFWSRIAKQGKFKNLTEPLGKYRIVSSSLDHLNNPYKSVLTSLLRKMILDENILDSDIDLYNNIFNYSKAYTHQTEVCKKSINVENLVFRLLSFIIGDNYAASFMVAIKNNYYSYRLR